MTEFVRTADENFDDLPNFPYAPNYHQWQDLRMHYVDEGPKDGPVMLLPHGMPTWAYLYRDMIPGFVQAGYRCIAPDHMGFGRSDKPTDIHWYTIARHTEILTSLIVDLDLQHITLVCQDWGGPTGLAQAAMMPERFDHLVILNTWLHHPEYEYSEGITTWNAGWQEGGRFNRPEPDLGLLLVMSSGLMSFDEFVLAFSDGKDPGCRHHQHVPAVQPGEPGPARRGDLRVRRGRAHALGVGEQRLLGGRGLPGAVAGDDHRGRHHQPGRAAEHGHLRLDVQRRPLARRVRPGG